MRKRKETVKLKIERLFPMKKEWMNFRVTPIFKKDPGYRRFKTSSGAFVMVSKKKREYLLSYNGERFADGSEFNSFERDFASKKYYQLAKIKKIYTDHMAIDPDADDYKKPVFVEEDYDPDNDPDYDPSESIEDMEYRLWLKRNPRKPGQRF